MRLIDADALQKALAERWYEAPAKLSGIKVSVLIDEQPTIEPKTGRWIEASTDGAVFCSECGTEWLSEAAKYYKFCPICGARMESEE